MEINLNNAIQNASPATTNNSAGVTAPQTDAQRADIAATRAVAPKETQNLENQAASSDQKRFDRVRSAASSVIEGKNPFLNDYKFTIYGASNSSKVGEYEIRFTDLSTGVVEVKTEAQLVANAGSGDLVSGQV